MQRDLFSVMAFVWDKPEIVSVSLVALCLQVSEKAAVNMKLLGGIIVSRIVYYPRFKAFGSLVSAGVFGETQPAELGLSKKTIYNVIGITIC